MSGLQNLQQWAKKCIELRGVCVELIPSFVAVACFLPGKVKDLPEPPRLTKIASSFQPVDFHSVPLTIFVYPVYCTLPVISCDTNLIRMSGIT